MMIRTNDLILRTMTVLISFILLGFSVYIFLAGHNAPGGGFIGGLMTSAAIVLMYMAYGYEAVNKILPINYRILIGVGLLIALATAIGSFVFGQPFLSQTFDYFHIPVFGEVELATATLFDIGVYLTVIGISLTIVLTISEDQ
ncbi:multicomponent Na+:H+ antiporter subunit B [Gracilibacillus ureilyticus]|uniref:Multicomponent Na+:H+ antiporter subunit B n=2 Tax=Gracilibacillus ureilyticus TaxID=531814 RepID=A0A1H9LE51_9BACI|nr:multicomponent Na+:H+ antiporter subunit B [Gracilibacillus ureilyticus]